RHCAAAARRANRHTVQGERKPAHPKDRSSGQHLAARRDGRAGNGQQNGHGTVEPRAHRLIVDQERPRTTTSVSGLVLAPTWGGWWTLSAADWRRVQPDLGGPLSDEITGSLLGELHDDPEIAAALRRGPFEDAFQGFQAPAASNPAGPRLIRFQNA